MKLSAWISPILLATAVTCYGQHYVISTFAGGVPPRTPAPAIQVSLPFPTAVATDAENNSYIVSRHSVFKVDANGILTLIAGNSRAGDTGDGGPATSAQLRLDSTLVGYAGALPPAVAADRSGNLYVADNGNWRIRKISPMGVITTVAGTGISGFSGDGGAATRAQISYALGLAVDADGNLWIADSGNNRIRQVGTDGSIRTVAGDGSCGFSGDGGMAVSARLCHPTGIAIDDSVNVFIADTDNNRLRKIGHEGTIVTVAGIGPSSSDPTFYCKSGGDGVFATGAALCLPTNVAVDSAGNLFLADMQYDSEQSWQEVRKISADTKIATVAGGACVDNGLGVCDFSYFDGSSLARTYLNGPLGITVDRTGALLIADPFSCVVRKLSPGGAALSIVAGDGSHGYSGDGGRASDAQIAPNGLAVDVAGQVLLADSANDRVRRVSRDGEIVTVAGNGSFGSSGDGGAATKAQLAPLGVAVDGAGNMFIADFPNRDVRKVSVDGIISTVAGGSAPISEADSVAADQAGNLYIASDEGIRKISPGGDSSIISKAKALGLAVDDSGNLFYTEYGRVARLSPNGSVVIIAGNGTAGSSGDGGRALDAQIDAQALAVDAAGSIYLVETFNNSIRKVSQDGLIYTIAGNGSQGYTGDGGPATEASLATPLGIAVDREGNVYVADSANDAIRVLRPVERMHHAPHE